MSLKEIKKELDNVEKTLFNIDTILVEGTFYAPSGYSSATREFMHHFIKRYEDKYKNIYLIDRQWDSIRMHLPNTYKDTIVKHTVKTGSDIKDVDPAKSMIIRWGLPSAFDYDGFEGVPHRIKGIYFVWECDRLPALWTDIIIKYYDVVFTSSKASKKAIETSLDERRSKIPVEIIPHGVATHYYKIEGRTKTLDGFTFLFVGTFSKRKAPMELIKAFIQEFKAEENVRLLWKIGNVSDPSQMLTLRREIQRMLFKLNENMSDAPKIIIDMNTYDHDILNEIYNEADALVQVSRGEAWGLPILNAMATGTPVLTLDKGGHRAFCNKKNSFFVKSDGLEYANGENDWYANHHAVKWNVIDLEDYRRMLRVVYEDEDARESKVKESVTVVNKFTWDNVVKHAKTIFNKYNKLIENRYESS